MRYKIPLVESSLEFARSKPPKFLRPKETQRLFNSLDLSDAIDLHTYAAMHLAYYLGLRPKEIRLLMNVKSITVYTCVTLHLWNL